MYMPKGISPGTSYMNLCYTFPPQGNEILCPANGSNIKSIHHNSFLQDPLVWLAVWSLNGSYQLMTWRMAGRLMGVEA